MPLKSRCSRKCESPASAGLSSREPVRTQRPRATERTEGIASVIDAQPGVELRRARLPLSAGQRGSSAAAPLLTARVRDRLSVSRGARASWPR